MRDRGAPGARVISISLYDQDRRWVGSYDIPGTRRAVLDMVAAKVATLPADSGDADERRANRAGGRPALFRIGTAGDLLPLPTVRA